MITKEQSAANRILYQPFAEKWADFNGLPRWAVIAQIGQESQWDPNAVSPCGAQGLMQIMPFLFTELQTKMKDREGFDFTDVMDPEQNIHAGCFEMRDLLDRLASQLQPPEHQLYALALAAYNAGAHAVFKCGGIPDIHETKEYVRLIMAQNPGNGPGESEIA